MAWTTSVWGSASKAAVISSALGGTIREGEEECMICRADMPASVSLRPCCHSICLACVERMRAATIFKPDKGVKCPYCRTFVDEYQPTRNCMEDPAVKEIVTNANKAAETAAKARTFVPPPQPAPQQHRPQVDPSEGVDWLCEYCSNRNYANRTYCNMCKKAPSTKKRIPAKYPDILKSSDEEILATVEAKLHPGLNRCFQEAGMPYSNNKVTGTQEGIIAALKSKGEERLLKLVSVVAKSGKVHELAVHFFGNYTVQDLMVATAKLRAATSQQQHSHMLDGFRVQHDGLDPFGALQRGLLVGTEEMAKHANGTYVLQKAMELGSLPEVLSMAACVFRAGLSLCGDTKGVFVMLKATQQLCQFLAPETAADIQAVVEPLAAAMLDNYDKTRYHCFHQLSGNVVMNLLQAGLPAPNCLQLASRLATQSKEFARNNNSMALVTQLLTLQPRFQEAAEATRDLTCMVAMSLRGEFAAHMMDEGVKGLDMVQMVLERLAEEQEVAWVVAICQELVSHGQRIVHDVDALEVLKYALSINVFDPATVESQLDHLQALTGSGGGVDFDAIRSDVFGRIYNAPPPAPPKYLAPSYLQPEQKCSIVDGVFTPMQHHAGAAGGGAARVQLPLKQGKANKKEKFQKGAKGKQLQQQQQQQAAQRGKGPQRPGPHSTTGSDLSSLAAEASYSTLGPDDTEPVGPQPPPEEPTFPEPTPALPTPSPVQLPAVAEVAAPVAAPKYPNGGLVYDGFGPASVEAAAPTPTPTLPPAAAAADYPVPVAASAAATARAAPPAAAAPAPKRVEPQFESASPPFAAKAAPIAVAAAAPRPVAAAPPPPRAVQPSSPVVAAINGLSVHPRPPPAGPPPAPATTRTAAPSQAAPAFQQQYNPPYMQQQQQQQQHTSSHVAASGYVSYQQAAPTGYMPPYLMGGPPASAQYGYQPQYGYAGAQQGMQAAYGYMTPQAAHHQQQQQGRGMAVYAAPYHPQQMQQVHQVQQQQQQQYRPPVVRAPVIVRAPPAQPQAPQGPPTAQPPPPRPHQPAPPTANGQAPHPAPTNHQQQQQRVGNAGGRGAGAGGWAGVQAAGRGRGGGRAGGGPVQQGGEAWTCNVCTYKHSGGEASFLICAMCTSEKGAALPS